MESYKINGMDINDYIEKRIASEKALSYPFVFFGFLFGLFVGWIIWQ